ncbi:MAG: hypothetical protein JXX28_02115 [Deltaproteobacteria bacterium]|nr:hypothetical protein [Deltaproteobacteria bacterium]
MAPKNFSQGMQDEVSRQLQARFVRSGPGRELYQLYHRAKSGALFSPRYIIAGVSALFGLIVMGCLGAGGLIAAWFGMQS